MPLPPTALVGRERETARLSRLLSEHRLVTPAGPGRCGKTRLAAAVCDPAGTRPAGSVCWVELGALTDPRTRGQPPEPT